LIVTHPEDTSIRAPVIFVVGWLSCDSSKHAPARPMQRSWCSRPLQSSLGSPPYAWIRPVKGYVIDGGWIKTWYEHMLEIERRRLMLAGHGVSELNTLMKRVEEFDSGYLLDRLPPREIFARRAELKSLWDGVPDHQYCRPIAYYQQLQDLNLMAAGSGVRGLRR
jgi:hypothetical protein